MNGWILTAVGVAACAMAAIAGTPIKKAVGHRVVIEFVGEQPTQREALLNNVENLLTALGGRTQIIVVAHGGGLGLLFHPEKGVADRVAELARRHVTFAACENTMRRKNVTKEDLVPESITVDSGVAEVVRRQEAGWSYIKSGG